MDTKRLTTSNEEKDASIFLTHILSDFSVWFPKALSYGFAATDLYSSEDGRLMVSFPLPIIRDGNYMLWTFVFCEVKRISPRSLDFLIPSVLEVIDSRLRPFIEILHIYVIAERVTTRIPPRCGKKRSIYVIKSDYVWKVYEIIARAVEGFVRSFRDNVRYGEGLLELCDELEKFAERMRRRAAELKEIELKERTTTQPSPTHHPPKTRQEERERKQEKEQRWREEAKHYLDTLTNAEILR
ncbi:hypothetical protein [Archaeoglobus sp.]